MGYCPFSKTECVPTCTFKLPKNAKSSENNLDRCRLICAADKLIKIAENANLNHAEKEK